MKNFQDNKLSREEMKTILGGVLQMDCYCLNSHGEPSGGSFGCVTLDGCTSSGNSVCSGSYTCSSVGGVS